MEEKKLRQEYSDMGSLAFSKDGKAGSSSAASRRAACWPSWKARAGSWSGGEFVA